MSRSAFAILLPSAGVWTLFSGCSQGTSPVVATEGTSPAADHLADGNEDFKKYFVDRCEMMLSPGPLIRAEFEANFDRASEWVKEADHPKLTPYIFAYTLAAMRVVVQQHERQLYSLDGHQVSSVRSDSFHDLIAVSVYFLIIRLVSTAQSEAVRGQLLDSAASLGNTFSTSPIGWQGCQREVVSVYAICDQSVAMVKDTSIDCRSTVIKAGQWRMLSDILVHESLSAGWREPVANFFNHDALKIHEQGIKLSAGASKAFLNCLRILANELDALVPGSVSDPRAISKFNKSRNVVIAEIDPRTAAKSSNHLSTSS